MRPLLSSLRTLVLLAVLAVSAVASARAQMPQPPAPTVRVETTGEPDSLAFLALDPARIPHRRLRDRVPAFVSDDSLSGIGPTRAASWGQWRQLYHELQRSRVRGGRALPDLDDLSARGQGHALAGRVPLALQHVRYARLRRDAMARGLVRVENGRLRDVPGAASPYEARQVFAAGAFVRGGVHHGLTVRFVVDEALVLSGEGARPRRMRVDAGDGAGWREVRLGDEVAATYASAGEQVVTVEATYGGETLSAQTTLAVAEAAAAAPVPMYDANLLLLWQQSARYDVLGRQVAQAVDEVVGAGYHAAEVEVSGWAPGVYVVVVECCPARRPCPPLRAPGVYVVVVEAGDARVSHRVLVQR